MWRCVVVCGDRWWWWVMEGILDLGRIVSISPPLFAGDVRLHAHTLGDMFFILESDY